MFGVCRRSSKKNCSLLNRDVSLKNADYYATDSFDRIGSKRNRCL